MQSKRGISDRLQQTLAERRKLKNETVSLKGETVSCREEIEQLANMVQHLENETREKQREIDRLEAEQQLAKVQIKGMTEVNATLSANVTSLLAQYVASASRVTNGSAANQKMIEDII